MNKKLIIIVLVAVFLLTGFAWVYAKHTPKSEATETEERQPTPEELKAGPTPVVVSSDKILSQEKHQQAMEARGRHALTQEEHDQLRAKVPADMMVTEVWMNDVYPPSVRSLEEVLQDTFWCRIRMQSDDCCYYYPGGDPNLWCMPEAPFGGPEVEGVYWAMLQDPEYQEGYYEDCSYPYYPMAVDWMRFILWAPAACTVVVEFWIEDVYPTDSGYCQYPAANLLGTRLVTVGPDTIAHPGATLLIDALVDPPLCMYDRFMVGVSLLNDNWFDPTGGTYCPDYHYDFAPTVYFARQEANCWSWYAYGNVCFYFGWWGMTDVYSGGVVYLQAGGYIHDDIVEENCPPETVWYFKPPKLDFEVDEETGDTTWYSYAPDGMPDFHQYDEAFPNGGLAYCGPTALANCLWWLAAAGRCPVFWDDTDGDGNEWDPDEADTLVNFLARFIGTDPVEGTEVHAMDEGLEYFFYDYSYPPIWLSHDEVPQPTFDYIQYQLRICQDVLLLLGFWYQDPSSGDWYRIGGHWVTLAGVDYMNWKFAFSDPALNLSCGGCTVPGDDWPWKSDGYFLPHIPPPNISHDDAGNVSHDVGPLGYAVLPESESPGGFLWLPDYEVYMLDLNVFLGQNTPEEFANYQAPSVPEPLPTIVTEVEYAKVICPASKRVWKDIWSSRMNFTANNQGGFGDVWDWYHGEGWSGGYMGSIYMGDDPTTLAGDYGGDEGLGYEPLTRFVQDTLYFYRTIPGEDDLEYRFERHYALMVHNQGLPLELETYWIGAFDPEEGPCEDAIFLKYVITNRGQEPITDIYKAVYNDADVGDYESNFVDGIEEFSTMWMYELTYPNILFGMLQKPVYEGGGACGGIGVSQAYWIYDEGGWNHDSLFAIMQENPWSMDYRETGMNEDMGMMLIDYPFSLDPGESYCNEYIFYAYDTADPVDSLTFGMFLYQLLKQEGFYRGDVDCNGVCGLPDIVYLINYVLKGDQGPKPFDDQGDVNCDGYADIVDIVYLVGYVLRGGPPPIDKNRFFDEPYKTMFSRPGLVNDPVWQNLPFMTLP